MIETMFRTVSPVHGSFSNEEFAQGCMLLRACGDGDLQKVQETLEQSPSLLNFADYDRARLSTLQRVMATWLLLSYC